MTEPQQPADPAGSWPPPPPAYPPSYAWPTNPPVPAKRRRTALWVTLVVLFLLVAGCAGVLVTKAVRAGQGADQAVNAFLDAAQRGDTTAALSHACPEATPADVPQIRSHKVRGVQVVRADGRTTADLTVDVTFTDGSTHRDVVHLEKQNGTWLVCGVQRLR